jgi:hypothetical protein
MAAWFPDMSRNFYLCKNPMIVKNSATAEAKEEKGIDW